MDYKHFESIFDIQRINDMKREYWLFDSNRSEVRRVSQNKSNEDQFNKYVFIDNWKIIGILVKELLLLKNKEEFKIVSKRNMEKASFKGMEKN